MTPISEFDGQQTDERILYTVTAHPFVKVRKIINTIVVSSVLLLIVFIITSTMPQALALRFTGFIILLIIDTIIFYWFTSAEKHDRTFITDRRIIRFETHTPILTTKRSLFWNEVLKAKAYAPDFLYRTLHIGQVIIEPQLSDNENVIIHNVAYYEDLANYIDKILFTYKNKQDEISLIKPFVPKPKGQRD